MINSTGFKLPPRSSNAAGQPRRVGFELEFTGLTLEQVDEVLVETLGGRRLSSTAAQRQIDVQDLGEFGVEIDWNYLKRLAREYGEYEEELSLLSEAASLIVPVEIVCPPLTIDRLDKLEDLVVALRNAGARGTDDSPIAAFGVHINPELPDLTAPTLNAYIKAFCLLQWWLVDANRVDLSRRITPYIDLYPDEYLKRAIARRDPDMDTMIADYLEFNDTRNRALDLLPVLMEIDPTRIRAAVDDHRIKARPTFHYRLPNCLIGSPGWRLCESWNLWWTVEVLASRPQALAALCDEFLVRWRPLFGVSHSEWRRTTRKWLTDSALV